MIKNVHETMKHPRMLLWFMLVPQLLLLLLNWRAWQIVRGEMSAEQLRLATSLGGYEVALLLGAIALLIILLRLKRPVNLLHCGIILLTGIGYLWFFTAHAGDVIPTTIADWMLPGSQIIYYQYALIMPAIFYAGLRLACAPLRVPKAADIGVSLLTVVAVPVAWYAAMRLASAFWRYLDPAVYVLLTLAIGSTVLLLLAFLRVLTHAYLALSSVSWGRPVMLFTAGLLAPIGGLLLNRKIPFPYDFQSQSVYVLTCLNALFLLLPFTGSPRRNRLVWCLRCMTYPFSLYFFIVFLPFLPLSLPAMIAAGAGFLILAPTLLFIVHTRTLIEEARALRQSWGSAYVLLAFAACASLIPLGLTGRALLDQQALTQALDAAYRPDYAAGPVNINRTALKRTLTRLQDIKHGIYLPFITDAYDALVLDGMVLPDPKREYLETLFFGQPFESQHQTGMFTDVFNPAAQRRRARHRNRVTLPPRNVQIASTQQQTQIATDTATTILSLSLANQGGNGSEFVTDITLPAGVFITGYWLHVGEQRVPGRIVDKKAAMWVYHMIRDQTRRDPGMLVYNADGTVRLSVFPFAAAETRTTEIAFSYPTGMSPRLQIGEKAIDLTSATPPQPPVFLHREACTTGRLSEDRRLKTEDQPRAIEAGTTTLLIPAATAAALPAITRRPYLHLIVDCSQQAASASPGFAAAIERLASTATGMETCRITLANYAFAHLTPDLIPLAEAAHVLDANQGSLPFRGVLSPERAIKSALLDMRENPTLTADGVPMVPVFVVVKAESSPLLRDEDGFGPFADLVPDTEAYYVTRDNGSFDAYAMRRQDISRVSAVPPPAPVIVLRAGSVYGACPVERSSVVCLNSTQPPEYLDSADNRYRPLDRLASLSLAGLSARGLSLMQAWAQTRYQPASAEGKRRELLNRSRQDGILIPDTAYIVVENQAQWDMLNRAEKKSLKADNKLAFDEFIESPAPPLWLLAPIVLLLTARSRRRQKTAVRN